jgi:hypothetical protein
MLAPTSAAGPKPVRDVSLRPLRREDASAQPESPVRRAAAFLPEVQALAAILKRPNLDERLAHAVVPDRIDVELFSPATLTATRLDLALKLEQLGTARSFDERLRILAALEILETEIRLDEDVYLALSALLEA